MIGQQKIKSILIVTFICMLLLVANDIFARAGGGSGSGKGGGGIFGLIIWGIYTIIITVVLIVKTISSKNIISWASKKDHFWDANKMKAHAKSMFFSMQQAWMDRNIDSVKELITEELYEDYKQQLAFMTNSKEINMLESIDVSSIRIISCEDFNDNTKDSFIAYIKGSMIDYTIYEKTKRVKKNHKKEVEDFKDTYHFVRQDNKWLLNYIDNDVTISDLIYANNYREK